MEKFGIKEGSVIVDHLIKVIQENKQYLSDIDGATGDGDHGINMNKGFTLCAEELDRQPGDLVYALNMLSRILLMKIGGSMGPLYGKFFKSLAKALEGYEEVDKAVFGKALQEAEASITSISPAKTGDKTLMDTLIPAVAAYAASIDKSFSEALEDMKNAAIEGRDSTLNMAAKLGRASRLGDRSKGFLDAGATSCCLILCSMADSITHLLRK